MDKWHNATQPLINIVIKDNPRCISQWIHKTIPNITKRNACKRYNEFHNAMKSIEEHKHNPT